MSDGPAGRDVPLLRPRFPESGTWCESSNDSGPHREGWHTPQPASCFEISPHAGRTGPLPVLWEPVPAAQAARRRPPEKEPLHSAFCKKKREENQRLRRPLLLRQLAQDSQWPISRRLRPGLCLRERKTQQHSHFFLDFYHNFCLTQLLGEPLVVATQLLNLHTQRID